MNPIVKIYVELIKKGKKKIKEVPENLKKEVQKALKNEKI